jgi:hypothetical protein
MSIDEINHRLDTRLYSRLELPSDTIIILPDSVQEKFAKALNREVPEQVLDSLTTFTPQYIEQTLRNIKRDCKEDTLCVRMQYQEHVKQYKEEYREMYANGIMPTKMILRAANWNIKRAIPVLEKAIGDEKYDQPSVLMALAKLGNDSIKRIVGERYTLNHLLQTTEADTINDELRGAGDETIQLRRDGFTTAMYLKDKEILLNIIDLIYVRGKYHDGLGVTHIVSGVVYDFDDYNFFHDFPNYDTLRKICHDYASSIWHLEDKKLNKKEQQELQTLLSTEYRNKIREQLREWIIENVNFE